MSIDTHEPSSIDRASLVARRSGKFLTFRLDDEEYALEILSVFEIISAQSITRVPGNPDYVCGVINLRGRVIPVVSLRVRMGLPVATDAAWCMIVVRVNSLPMAMVVDSVSDVITCSAETVDDVPSFGLHIDSSYLLGVDKSGPRVRLLLDIDRIMAGDTRYALADGSTAGSVTVNVEPLPTTLETVTSPPA